MSEIVELVGTVTGTGWMFLSAVVVIALGLFVLDRRPKTPASEKTETSSERRAA